MTTIMIDNRDRDWLMRIKEKKKLISAAAAFERVIKLIKKHKMEDEI